MIKFILLISFYIVNLFSKIAIAENNLESKNNIKDSSELKWEFTNIIDEDEINWETYNEPIIKTNKLNLNKFGKILDIKAISRSVKVNGKSYPEISNYVPNAFVEDPNKLLTASVRGISKTRHCNGKNFSSKCTDGVIDIDFNLFNTDKFSFNPKFGVQSLSNRGTNFGEGINAGFKTAYKLSPKFYLSFGGENIIHFDETIDLGRNFYIITSTYYPISLKKGSLLFVNAGIGSDFYGYKGNGFLGSTSCLGSNTLTGNGSNNCNWGPIGSISFALNDRISFNNEWFGYSYGSGISIRPFQNRDITLSLYATDYLYNFPKYAREGCFANKCSTRFYGSLSLTY